MQRTPSVSPRGCTTPHHVGHLALSKPPPPQIPSTSTTLRHHYPYRTYRPFPSFLMLLLITVSLVKRLAFPPTSITHLLLSTSPPTSTTHLLPSPRVDRQHLIPFKGVISHPHYSSVSPSSILPRYDFFFLIFCSLSSSFIPKHHISPLIQDHSSLPVFIPFHYHVITYRLTSQGNIDTYSREILTLLLLYFHLIFIYSPTLSFSSITLSLS